MNNSSSSVSFNINTTIRERQLLRIVVYGFLQVWVTGLGVYLYIYIAINHESDSSEEFEVSLTTLFKSDTMPST